MGVGLHRCTSRWGRADGSVVGRLSDERNLGDRRKVLDREGEVAIGPGEQQPHADADELSGRHPLTGGKEVNRPVSGRLDGNASIGRRRTE